MLGLFETTGASTFRSQGINCEVAVLRGTRHAWQTTSDRFPLTAAILCDLRADPVAYRFLLTGSLQSCLQDGRNAWQRRRKRSMGRQGNWANTSRMRERPNRSRGLAPDRTARGQQSEQHSTDQQCLGSRLHILRSDVPVPVAVLRDGVQRPSAHPDGTLRFPPGETGWRPGSDRRL